MNLIRAAKRFIHNMVRILILGAGHILRMPILSLQMNLIGKIRLSYAEVGQAGAYIQNYYTTPTGQNYGGGWFNGFPVQYPIDGVSSYIPNNVQYDPNLVPQNTKSYEIGGELKFFQNRLGIDYTYSRQNVVDQIFSVPLSGSTGIRALLMNGGKVHTLSHEIILYITPVLSKDFQWD